MNVKVVSKRGQSALVEYLDNGRLKRATIPASDISDEGTVVAYKLRMGVPYGLEWSKLVKLQATAEDLEQNLRNRGIWTGQDALTNVQAVLGAIQATYKIDLGTLLNIAKEAK